MAFIEGLHLYARDRDFTIAVIQKYTKLKDPSVLSKSHDYFVKRTAVVPLTDPTAIKNALPEKLTGRRPEDRGPILSAGRRTRGHRPNGSFSGFPNGIFHDWPDDRCKRRKHRTVLAY